MNPPEYNTSSSGRAHQLTYTVEAYSKFSRGLHLVLELTMIIVQGVLYGSGTGARRDVAKEAAATQALEQMHQQYPGYRALY